MRFLKSVLLLTMACLLGLPVAVAQVDSSSLKNQSASPDSSSVKDIPVGYGRLNNKEITGAVRNMLRPGFNEGNINNPLQLITGRIAGLDISKAGADPNESFYLRLRGLNTFYASDQPLIVIDGIPGGNIQNLMPADVESFTVLKDAASSSIYGLRGTNGIILIETKKGSKGAPAVEYNAFVSLETVAKNTPVMNAGQWRSFNEVFKSQFGLSGGTDFGFSTNWFRQVEQAALSHTNNVAVSGGNDKSSYRASLNYRNVEGVQKYTGNSDFSGRVVLKEKLLHDRFDLSVEMAGTEKKINQGFPEAFKYATIYNPTAPVRSNDPAYARYNGYFQQVLFDYYNPVSMIELNQRESRERILDLSINGSLKLAKNLTVTGTYAIQQTGLLGGEYFGKKEYWGGLSHNGLASRNYYNATSEYFESFLSYYLNAVSGLDVKILAGYTFQDFANEGFSATGGDFLSDAFTFNNLSAAREFKTGTGTVSSFKNSNKLIAFLGRASASYKEFLFLNASARYEGSSRFGTNNKWKLLPSISAGIDVTKLLDKSDYLLKLRFGYGVTGNEPSQNYLSQMRFQQGWYNYISGAFSYGYVVTNNSNPDLRSETTKEFNTGLDFNFMNSKITGSVDFFSRKSSDLFFPFQVPSPPNLFGYQWLNAGKIKSSGMELSLGYDLIAGSDLSYSISLDQSFLFNNTITSISADYSGTTISAGTILLGDVGSPGGCCYTISKIAAGEPAGQIFTMVQKGISPDGYRIYEDVNKDTFFDNRDSRVVGNGLPEYLLGFGNNLKYKDWDLGIFFRGVFGHSIVNLFRAQYEVPRFISTYNLPVTTPDLKNPETNMLLNSFGGVLTNYDVEKGSFVSLDNISLGYNFRLSGNSTVRRLRLYLAANRLFYITKYKGSDPEPRYRDNDQNLGTYNNPLVAGADRRITWPRTRSVTFGLNVEFN